MKTAIFFLFLIFTAACAVNTVESQKRAENQPPVPPGLPAKQTVLVELFTSEG
jgi:hypothetical protein